MGKNDSIFYDLMPETEKVYFANRERKATKVDFKSGQQGLAEELMTQYVNADGEILTPKNIIDKKTIAFVMANPSPQNTKALYELAGLAAPKQVDITSDGKSVDALLASLAIKEGINEDAEVHG